MRRRPPRSTRTYTLFPNPSLFRAYVIGTGRAADRQTALDFGAQEFVDLENDTLEDIGGVDLGFDVIGGDIQKRSAGLVRAGGTLVSIVGPARSEEHTSELQSLMSISYAVFCLKKKTKHQNHK